MIIPHVSVDGGLMTSLLPRTDLKWVPEASRQERRVCFMKKKYSFAQEQKRLRRHQAAIDEQREIELERLAYERQRANATKQCLEKLQNRQGFITSKSPSMSRYLFTQAAHQNFFVELNALLTINHPEGTFDGARRKLFEAISQAIFYGDDYPDAIFEEIREAGKLLNQSGGSVDMHDYLVWSFIPKHLHRLVDLCFDGIGEWRA